MDTDLNENEENDITILTSEYVENANMSQSSIKLASHHQTRKMMHRPSVRSISETPNVIYSIVYNTLFHIVFNAF